MSEAVKTETSTARAGAGSDLARLEAAVAEGLRLARQAGREEPTLRDAVWELMLEAGDTLKRLPDRERGWLTAVARGHWPDYARSAAADAGRRPAPASAAAIDRLDCLLAWLPQGAGANGKRDMAVLLGMACGVRVTVLRRRLGCGRRTVYDVRDRGIARICGWLRQRSAYCRSLA